MRMHYEVASVRAKRVDGAGEVTGERKVEADRDDGSDIASQDEGANRRLARGETEPIGPVAEGLRRDCELGV